jgi:hypothetical protein
MSAPARAVPTTASSEPSPASTPIDLVIEGAAGDSLVIVAPCHRVAADWLRAAVPPGAIRLGEGIALEDRELDGLVGAATRAGFRVRRRSQREPEMLTVGTREVAVSV